MALVLVLHHLAPDAVTWPSPQIGQSSCALIEALLSSVARHDQHQSPGLAHNKLHKIFHPNRPPRRRSSLYQVDAVGITGRPGTLTVFAPFRVDVIIRLQCQDQITYTLQVIVKPLAYILAALFRPALSRSSSWAKARSSAYSGPLAILTRPCPSWGGFRLVPERTKIFTIVVILDKTMGLSRHKSHQRLGKTCLHGLAFGQAAGAGRCTGGAGR